MIRSLDLVVAVLHIACPQLPDNTAETWGAHIRELAISNGHDPVTQVAILEGESGCNPRAVYRTHVEESIGLMGINLRNYPECRDESGKLDTSSLECDNRRAALLEPLTNLTIGSQLIAINRAFCRERVGGLFWQWLPSYQGSNRPRDSVFCGMQLVQGKWRKVRRTRATKRVIKRRRELLSAALREVRS